ncbi:MAG: hypothetical protein ACRDTJ_15745 [Pseudonocardiaceae bacterium]
MPAAGGEPPHVTITLDYDTLIKQLSGVTLDYGQQLSPAQTRLAACDCKIIPEMMSMAIMLNCDLLRLVIPNEMTSFSIRRVDTPSR